MSEKKKMTIIVFSGDMDKAYAAFILASSAAAMDFDVTMFFTFWGLNLLKKDGLRKAPLSKMNMLGLGKMMMQRKMKEANVMSLEDLFRDARELGVKMLACSMTMDVMGISKEDLVEVDGYVGAVEYLSHAKDSQINLFI
ncbi:MAG: DsrE/DsrF/DrsH-like family protein [Archaeoglobi archaeon]|nr:DsrE/DsrF/DrsH-like family protein [Candidatus Mnemosynella sp.]